MDMLVSVSKTAHMDGLQKEITVPNAHRNARLVAVKEMHVPHVILTRALCIMS